MKNQIFKIVLLWSIANIFLYASSINIAVAANVSYAIQELHTSFNKLYPNIKVNIILGGSGSLTAKIKNNAPYDIFMSANMLYPTYLYTHNYTKNKPKVYAKGGLAILSVKNIDISQGLKSLLNPSIKKIAIANPKTAPYGVASVEALKNQKIFNTIENKIIYAESISKTLIYTLKACDVGIVARSLLYSSNLNYLKENKNYKQINSKLFTPIKQGIVILTHGQHNSDVDKFYNFIFSKVAKGIFSKYGYEM